MIIIPFECLREPIGFCEYISITDRYQLVCSSNAVQFRNRQLAECLSFMLRYVQTLLGGIYLSVYPTLNCILPPVPQHTLLKWIKESNVGPVNLPTLMLSRRLPFPLTAKKLSKHHMS